MSDEKRGKRKREQDVHLRTSMTIFRKRPPSPSLRPFFPSAIQSPFTLPFFASRWSRMSAALQDRRERRATSRVSHSNGTPIDESGEASGKLRDEGEAKGEGGKGGKRTGGRSPS
jgi:hypothetical protein